MSIRKDSKSLFHRELKANEYPIKQTFTQKANDIPTKQTYTFSVVRCDRQKQEKPVPEITSGRVAL